MVKAVWKFECPGQDHFDLKIPAGAILLHFAEQFERPTLWALVDAESPKETRQFRLAGTGHELRLSNDEVPAYVGTCSLMGGNLILHLFEIN